MTPDPPRMTQADSELHGGRRSRRRKLLAAGAMLGVGFAVAVAGAQWLASGTGSGYAKAATVLPLTTESATVSGSLYPGGTGPLTLRVHNPNPFATTLSSVSPNGPITSDSAACDAGGHGVTFSSVSGLALAVPASSSAQFDLADSVAMAVTSADACQGATFTIPVSLNGGSGGPVTTTTTTIPGDGEVQSLVWVDSDGDTFGGFGPPGFYSGAWPPPAGWATNQDDCDDGDANVHPGANEIPGNGIDDNCNGTWDEG